ncbi:MAG: hypothetical protein ACRDD1_05250, partial [Planctomycetia bacterium]
MKRHRNGAAKLKQGRRIVALASIVAYCAVTIGLPLPGPAKDVSVPFPCMHRACGCQNARQCWTSCCCTTLTERLVWAAANDVDVPKYVDRRDALPDPADGLVDLTADADPPACCLAERSCARPKSCCDAANEPAEKVETGKGVATINTRQMAGCRGLSQTWLFSGAPALPPPVYTPSLDGFFVFAPAPRDAAPVGVPTGVDPP